jgi:hypothetical protein
MLTEAKHLTVSRGITRIYDELDFDQVRDSSFRSE